MAMISDILTLEITISEAGSLMDFIEHNTFDAIRNDGDIDSIEWLCNLCSVYKKLQEMAGEP